jgi:putative alpha-1,2-mannosidase
LKNDRLEIEGGTPDQRKIFATGVYHMLLDPTVFSDENGEYIGFDLECPGEFCTSGNETNWYERSLEWHGGRSTLRSGS